MKEKKFRQWFASTGVGEKTVQNRVSNCKNVEKYEGDLDLHFNFDQCKSLLDKLTYSKDDERQYKEAKHCIPIDGNLYNGTSTLKQSVNIYIKFCIYDKSNMTISTISSIEDLESNNNLTESEKDVLVKYRLGQSKFRKDLIDHWGGCSINGLVKTDLLIASHIKPYRECNDDEKYDVFNGLLLTPNYDVLFDKFLISFNQQGKIMISNKISQNDLEKLYIDKHSSIILDSKHNKYLDYHRSKFKLLNNQ